MAIYNDGKPVSGLNSIPRLTLAQYNALTVKPDIWIRTDAPESYKKLSADQVSYDSNNTVEDMLDKIATKPTIAYSQTNNSAKSFTFSDWSTYLVTIQTSNANPSIGILTKLTNTSTPKLVWLSQGTGASTTTVSGNTISCSESGYYYQMNLLALNY